MTKRTIEAVLYPVGAPKMTVTLESDESGSLLRDMQKHVGGCIEIFNVAEGMPDLVVNDEGLFSQRPNRAVYATKDMEEAGYLSQIDGHPVKEGELYTVLYGPIIAVGCDEDGDTVAPTPVEIENLRGHLGNPGSGLAEVVKIVLASKSRE